MPGHPTRQYRQWLRHDLSYYFLTLLSEQILIFFMYTLNVLSLL